MFIIIELTYGRTHVNILGSKMVSSTNLSYYIYDYYTGLLAVDGG